MREPVIALFVMLTDTSALGAEIALHSKGTTGVAADGTTIRVFDIPTRARNRPERKLGAVEAVWLIESKGLLLIESIDRDTTTEVRSRSLRAYSLR